MSSSLAGQCPAASHFPCPACVTTPREVFLVVAHPPTTTVTEFWLRVQAPASVNREHAGCCPRHLHLCVTDTLSLPNTYFSFSVLG